MAHHAHEFVVIGLGRFGSAVALTLESLGHYVLGIDENMEIVQGLSSQLSHVVALDATDELALASVDIGEFETVVVAIGTDFESNLLITVALKNIGIRHVICKTITRRQGDILLKVGADRVILPEYEAGRRLAEELITPALMERFPLSKGFSIAELAVPHSLANQSLAQSDLRANYGVNVLVVKRGDQVTTSPPAEFILLDDDILVVLATDTNIERLAALESE